MGLCPQHPEQCHLEYPEHSHGRRGGKAQGAAECDTQGVHRRMEADQGEGGGGAEEAEGEAGCTSSPARPARTDCAFHRRIRAVTNMIHFWYGSNDSNGYRFKRLLFLLQHKYV